MRKKISVALASVMAICMAGCSSDVRTTKESLSYDEAKTELDSLLTKVNATEVTDPTLDIYSDDVSESDALADIDTFDMAVEGNGTVNIEIAAPSELTSSAPDDWLIEMADEFNASGYTVGGKTATVSIRAISSGETVTYIKNGVYEPNAYVPSNYALGKMLEASGINTTTVTDRLVGNTAGVLIQKDLYDSFIEKYKEATFSNIIEASIAGDIAFAYTNPYTSATGLNILGCILKSFDAENPLSSTAIQKLQEYQQSAPPVAYTTTVLKKSAAKGVVNAMVMEEQALEANPTLKSGYVYIPAGIRHDHPVYSFDWNTEEENTVLKAFVDYCLTDDAQASATEKGFNQHDDYVSDDPGFSGTDWLSAQSIWKENKNGGNPVIAVFVADVSGSMDGTPISSLKNALISTSTYIGSENYIGLVSYSDDVTINLPVAQFDATQRAYFSGEVKNLTAGGGTATYDAVLTATDMLLKAKEEVPNAKLMLFVLSDGETNTGYKYSRISPVIDGLDIPVYSISYNYDDSSDELTQLSEINEAASISAESDDVVNQLRNLFNVNL